MDKTDTPRTDALEITCNRDCANYLTDLSRPLERDLTAAQERIRGYARAVDALHADLAAAQARIKELEGALTKLLKAADNSNCDSTACMTARAALKEPK